MEDNGRAREREKKEKKFRANATTDIKYWQISKNSNSILAYRKDGICGFLNGLIKAARYL